MGDAHDTVDVQQQIQILKAAVVLGELGSVWFLCRGVSCEHRLRFDDTTAAENGASWTRFYPRYVGSFERGRSEVWLAIRSRETRPPAIFREMRWLVESGGS